MIYAKTFLRISIFLLFFLDSSAQHTPLRNIAELRAHHFDGVNFADSNLVSDKQFLQKVFGFVRLYDNPNLPFPSQMDTLSLMIDALFTKAAANEKVYNFLTEDLNKRFQYGNYDFLGAYIRRYYSSRFRLEKNYPAADVRTRLDNLKHPGVGSVAPQLTMKAPDGTATSLTGIEAEYTLLVFWSTGCGHCIESLPLLKRIYDARRGSFEILAVSFDTDKALWEKFVIDNNLGWINYADLKGWDSKIASDFSVQGTPTYFLMDKNKKIIAKPVELKDLAAELQRLSII